MKLRPTSFYSATPMSSAYATSAASPSPWVRPKYAYSHNAILHQFELYHSGALVAIVKYSRQGAELRLESAETARSVEPQLVMELLPHVFKDALSKHVAVLPVSPLVRQFLWEHPAYWTLVPASERRRFQEPAPKEVALDKESTSRSIPSAASPRVKAQRHRHLQAREEPAVSKKSSRTKTSELHERHQQEGASRRSAARTSYVSRRKRRKAIDHSGPGSGESDGWAVPQPRARSKESGLGGYATRRKRQLSESLRQS